MKTSSIANAKNNLSQLIHRLEKDKTIHLTRYGKPVAVMMSETQYNILTSTDKKLFAKIQNWRRQIRDDCDPGFTEKELDTMRKESASREFTWDE